MAKAFSVASWNVKHFRGNQTRMERVVDLLRVQNPDVFALYEVSGSEVFTKMMTVFQGYTFQITEGPQSQEILIGVKNAITAFITQKVEFKSGNTYMRPGQLVTITVDGENYSLLFLHLASNTKPRGMGLRDDMLSRALKFRHKLDRTSGGRHTSNYIFLGDLNTMGMKYPYDKDIEASIEMQRLENRASGYYGMQSKVKSHNKTWWGGSNSSYEKAELDHVYASEHLNIIPEDDDHASNYNVAVKGWVEKATIAEQDQWINDYSDHSLLYFVVEKV